MVRETTLSSRLFDIVNHVMLTLLALLCLLPLIHILAVSFSDRAATSAGAVSLWPVNFNTLNYQRVLGDAKFLNSFGISVQRVLVGTLLSVLVTSITAYPLSLAKPFPGQRAYKFLLIFAMVFHGGLIPWFLVLRSLGLVNNFWGLIFPVAVQIWNVVIMVNFFRGIPAELSEAAQMDGASHWSILFHIYIPVSLPAMALVTLFTAVTHWNAWFDGLVLMNDTNKYPLQSLLQTMIVSRDYMRLLDARTVMLVSERSLRAAQIVIATLPVLLVYPFLQRYFVSGLKLGSVKG